MRLPALLHVLAARGRLGRLGYWREMAGIYLVFLSFDHVLVRAAHEPPPLLALGSIGLVWVLTSTLIRRTHDVGVTGWAAILLVGVSWGVAFQMVSPPGYSDLRMGAALVATLLPILLLGLVPGEWQTNRWGPSHRRPGSLRGYETAQGTDHGSIEDVQ